MADRWGRENWQVSARARLSKGSSRMQDQRGERGVHTPMDKKIWGACKTRATSQKVRSLLSLTGI